MLYIKVTEKQVKASFIDPGKLTRQYFISLSQVLNIKHLQMSASNTRKGDKKENWEKPGTNKNGLKRQDRGHKNDKDMRDAQGSGVAQVYLIQLQLRRLY